MQITRNDQLLSAFWSRLSTVSIKYLNAILLAILTNGSVTTPVAADSFVTFESDQVRPLALSPDGRRLYAVNTPDDRLEIFDIKSAGLVHVASVSVGMEPVAVATRNNGEVWVVNQLSDSISVVDVASTPPRVLRTLLVGDEPRDIVFAGLGGSRAFITTAHRGQNSPYTDPTNPGQLTTPGIGRADVWVFDALNLGSNPGGAPLTILTLFTDTPRALAVSNDGSTVYAAGFRTGNGTTTVAEGAVCNGGILALPCQPVPGEQTAPGGLPAPNKTTADILQPEVGLIVKFNGSQWVDELNRDWSSLVRFNLPDRDVFMISANTSLPAVTGSFSGVGTVLFDMAVNPASGKVYVSNTEAFNDTRFEGSRPSGSTVSTVQGRLQLSRITVITGASVMPRHLNKHIDYNIRPAPAGVKDNSLAIPMGMAITNDGNTLYLAAFGSSKIGVFNTAQLENNSFVPSATNHIPVSGGGPSGVALDEPRGRLYVLTRFNNAVAMINTATRSQTASYTLHNPEPASVVNGRRFLYDAYNTSSNGEAACASCHVFGDLDSLAWDLGNPLGAPVPNTNLPGPVGGTSNPFHPMKGPMSTQSLRGLANHGPMHWRGDRTAGGAGGNPLDTVGAFKKFNVAFDDLLGRTGPLTDAEMQAFADFVLQITYPPNPIRSLDNSLTPDQQAGRDFFFNVPTDVGFTCNACHVLNPSQGFFGSSGLMSFENESQEFKIPHLRNMYQKVGMFGMPAVPFFLAGNNAHTGDQIRGFGFLHDGSTDTLFRFHRVTVAPGFPLFVFPGGDAQRRQVEQFMFAFDSNLAPIVGQQVTLNGSNVATAGVRLNLMITRAAAGDADLIVKGIVDGKPRGWVRLTNGTFKGDMAAEAPQTDEALRALALSPGQELTYTAVPPGSGVRAGIDRDGDGITDADDNCPDTPNPDQLDSDGDGVGDVCDNCTLVANADQRDSNGDGYGNMCDADLNNDGLVNSLDLGLFKLAFQTTNADADLNGDGLVNSLDLGLFKQLFSKPPGPSALVP